MTDRGHLLTEQPNPASTDLDLHDLSAAFDIMNTEDRRIADAVQAAKPAIVAAIARIADALRAGGRLIYVGAGTSGRLGVLDAAECPPTFLSPPEMILGIIAGGDAALKMSIEGAEDSRVAGAQEIDRLDVGSVDVVFGIAAGGTTPFVHGALQRGTELGATTVFLACVPEEVAPAQSDLTIRVLTGPEVVTGSTRLKAGIATKMVLNMISTLTMVQLGKVYGNLMVDVHARACDKLVDRAIRTTMQATGLERSAAEQLLRTAGWHVKTAIVMKTLGVDREVAVEKLAAVNGHLRAALVMGQSSLDRQVSNPTTG